MALASEGGDQGLYACHQIVAWWLSVRDLKGEERWPLITVLVFFAVACLLYVLAHGQRADRGGGPGRPVPLP